MRAINWHNNRDHPNYWPLLPKLALAIGFGFSSWSQSVLLAG
jgi:hypothetical protein